jgi:hypothetical protein
MPISSTTSITLLHDDKTRAYQSTQRLCLAMVDVLQKKELAITNQNPRNDWRRLAPPIVSWVLCPEQNLLCYSCIAKHPHHCLVLDFR